MSVSLYMKGGKKKMQGYLVTRLDCSEDRVEELCGKGWALSPKDACAPLAPVKLEPVPEPVLEYADEPTPEPVYKSKKKKKSRKKG